MMKQYLQELNRKLREGEATEHTFRPGLERLLQRLSRDHVVTNEPTRVDLGAPDFVIRRRIGITQLLPIGYVETKKPGAKLDDVAGTDQLKRYLKFDNLILTDYVTFRWYVEGSLRLEAAIASTVQGRLQGTPQGETAVLELLMQFLEQEPKPITKPVELARRLAAISRHIERIALAALDVGEASDMLTGLKETFEKTLLPELTNSEFADMFAQTLAYGLFAARINHYGRHATGDFRRSEAAREIPKTNPFLRNFFGTITGVEIEDEPFIGFVDDLTAVMQYADIGSILDHFGRKTGREDPVVHFYETFLKAYDPSIRGLRGVYYTPEPVVSYIVHSVDVLLKERFGLKDGLADQSTVEVVVEEGGRKVKRTLPKVLILDPACGTGTFLYHVVKVIRERFMAANNAGEWSDFVRDHLLPRIYGFELLMAPYAVAHLKLAMQLAGQDLDEPLRSQWAYDFQATDRLNIFLTNSLRTTDKIVQTKLFGFERQIVEEANAAHGVKRELPIIVVIGNPPYKGHSANSSVIERRIQPGEYYWRGDKRVRAGKKGARQVSRTFIGSLLQDYYHVDGVRIEDKNTKWIENDYIKFLRFGQWRIQQTGHGIIAFITDNSYLDTHLFRGVRRNLMRSFESLWVLDLHGNQRKREKEEEGSREENVFDDTQQGTAIVIGATRPYAAAGDEFVKVEDLWGERGDETQGKYAWLASHDISSTPWRKVRPEASDYYFAEGDSSIEAEFRRGWSLSEIFPVHGWGIATRKDYLLIDTSRKDLVERMEYVRRQATADARAKYSIKDKDDWRLEEAVRAMPKIVGDHVYPILYRPFDIRYIYYIKEMIERGDHRWEIMRHMLRPNWALLATNQTKEEFAALVTDQLVEHKANVRYDGGYAFPLYLYYARKSDVLLAERTPNFSAEFLQAVAELSEQKRGVQASTLGVDITPEEVFSYVYAILQAPSYRSRYGSCLRKNFPRVPLISNVSLFCKLAELGNQLVTLHLMGDGIRGAQLVTKVAYPVNGDHAVKCVEYDDARQRVLINKTQYFEGVSPEVWGVQIGGHQVARKWLDDRRKLGKSLTAEDRTHYRRIIYVLNETIRLQKEIDAVIPGWPIH